MNEAVERAAKCMWEYYSEPLSLTDIARSAMLSRFHFARLFRDTTGVSPCRFLSAVRIHQAKHLLLTTSTSITDISFAVGYNSLGSFTNYFTRSVGISPGRFRRMALKDGFELPRLRAATTAARGAIEGTITLPEGFAGARVYMGAFATPIAQHPVAAATVVDVAAGGQSAPYRLPDVPAGAWFVHAIGVADTTDPEPWTRRISLVDRRGLVKAGPGARSAAAISLRPRRLTDPPVLLALPDLATPPAAIPAVPGHGGHATRTRASLNRI